MAAIAGNTKYLNGIRGIAAFMVINSHFFSIFFPRFLLVTRLPLSSQGNWMLSFITFPSIYSIMVGQPLLCFLC